jgi:iron complex outermembrane recepter protein
MKTQMQPISFPLLRFFTTFRIPKVAGLLVVATLQLNARVSVAADQLVQLVTLDVPANTLLEDALIEWGRKAGITVMIDTRSVTGQLAGKIHGTFSTADALKLLLRNSGLTYTREGQIVHIIPTNKKIIFERGGVDSAEVPSVSSDFNRESSRVEESDSIDMTDSSLLQEVLVTAQKTGVAERLQDVPVPISVISAQSLMQNNQSQIQDYFDQIPGLAVAESGSGLSIVSIRGITTGQNTNPTVGFTLDDVPLGGSTSSTAVSQVPIINPADLAQVEVLRGPQGTLYGDNSMGGLIRYVTVDPSTDHIFGDVRAGGSGVFNGTHVGYNVSSALNIPLTDTLAIRASAFSRLDPGYVDNAETGQRGVDTTKTGGGRIAAKWIPSSDFSLKLSALYEKTDQYGAPEVDVPTAGYPQTLGLGDLQQYNSRGTGYHSQEFKTANLTLNANLGGVKITTVSGYTVNEFINTYDLSWAFFPPPSSFGAPLIEDNNLHKFTQEVRLTDSIGPHLDWLIGGYYSQENNNYIEYTNMTDATTGAVVGPTGSIFYNGGPDRVREYAGFGALTWKVTDQFDVQFGGRESYITNPVLESYSGGTSYQEPPGPSTYTPPSPDIYRSNTFTYLVSPRFKLTPDVMVYARVANGFRPGSGTSDPQPTDTCVTTHTPCLVHPDKITNYEIGAKADFFSHVLSIDSSIYYIDWKDLQVTLVGPNELNYSGNGAGAKSQGVDLSLELKPLKGLTISTWGAWDQAVVTQSFANASAGDPLPYSARFSGNFTVEEEVVITGSVHAFVLGKEIYMGNRQGSFTSIGAPRQILPAYSQTDFTAGIKAEPWTLNLFINNVTDRRGVLYGGLGSSTAPYEFDYITPRTIGISVDRAF